MIFHDNYCSNFHNYLKEPTYDPLFFCGDALSILQDLPSESIDFCMTSPPYWGQRQYAGGGIGLEDTPINYVLNLEEVFAQIHRVLKPTGSFWLNIGDSYSNKELLGIPWRVVFSLTDNQGWILRNNVIWHKVKGGLDNSKDRLRNVHENVFHFVKQKKGYFYDIDSIRSSPRKAKVTNGAVVSATGVTGSYRSRPPMYPNPLARTERMKGV